MMTEYKFKDLKLNLSFQKSIREKIGKVTNSIKA